jgi:uncharacterized membrane protein YdjX (TVP38/TMEM64 family)
VQAESAPTDWRLRAALLGAFAATLCVLWWTGALADLAQPERVRALLSETGLAGPALWLLAFIGLQPFGVPGAAFMIPAALVWPPLAAILLCVAGAVGAGSFAFGLARWIGPDAILARLPERVRRRTAQARERGFRTAFVVRLVFFLFAPAHWALGISGIRFTPFVLGSALGFLPGMTVWVLATRELAGRLERAPAWEAIALGVAALALAAVWFWWRRRRKEET